MRRGTLIGIGRTAEVFEFGAGSVVKLLRPGIPATWAELEASLTAAVHARGLPTPAVHDVVELEGRAGVVFEHIEGPSMWTGMLGSVDAADRLARDLASLHLTIQAELAPAALPSLVERTTEKVDAAGSLSAEERAEANRLASDLDGAAGLCHGDFHPGNVILAGDGPVIIDWYDAAAGPSSADMVRTSLLIRPPAADDGIPVHLPGASAELLDRVHRGYLETVMTDRTVPRDRIRRWERVLAASRLGERAEPDDRQLMALWRDRNGDDDSLLIGELGRLGALCDDEPKGIGDPGG